MDAASAADDGAAAAGPAAAAGGGCWICNSCSSRNSNPEFLACGVCGAPRRGDRVEAEVLLAAAEQLMDASGRRQTRRQSEGIRDWKRELHKKVSRILDTTAKYDDRVSAEAARAEKAAAKSESVREREGRWQSWTALISSSSSAAACFVDAIGLRRRAAL